MLSFRLTQRSASPSGGASSRRTGPRCCSPPPTCELREPEQRRPAARPPAPEAAPADSLPSTLPGQLEAELPGGSLALSCARDLPTGARVAVVLAPGLFRIDVRHLEDTLKISIRNLSGAPIRSLPDSGAPTTILTTDDVTIERPVATNARLRLRIGLREANVVLSSLSGSEPGLGRVTVQAIIGPP